MSHKVIVTHQSGNKTVLYMKTALEAGQLANKARQMDGIIAADYHGVTFEYDNVDEALMWVAEHVKQEKEHAAWVEGTKDKWYGGLGG